MSVSPLPKRQWISFEDAENGLQRMYWNPRDKTLIYASHPKRKDSTTICRLSEVSVTEWEEISEAYQTTNEGCAEEVTKIINRFSPGKIEIIKQISGDCEL